MSEGTKGETVLVTGGSSYLGGWMIAALLREGLRVRTTLRDLARESQVRADVATQADPADRLSFFAADLLKDDGWERAMEGVDVLLHVASPRQVAPAREGTPRVLAAARKAGVRRVVMTSSLVAAIPEPGPGEGIRLPTDETVWTHLEDKGVSDATRAKTLAEQDAWAFMRSQGGPMTLATVLPAVLQGPVLGTNVSSSLEVVARLLGGKLPRLPRVGFSVVDVRDVVDLHLKAMRAPKAAGQRFIATGDFLWLEDVAGLLRERLGERAARVPTRRIPDLLVRLGALFDPDLREFVPRLGKHPEFSAARAARLLGWRPRPAAESIVDSAESLLRAGRV